MSLTMVEVCLALDVEYVVERNEWDFFFISILFKVQETKLKQEDGVKKVEKKQKTLRKLECPVIKVNSSEQSEECKTQ